MTEFRAIPRWMMTDLFLRFAAGGYEPEIQVSGIANPRIISMTCRGMQFVDAQELGWFDEEREMPQELVNQLVEEVESLNVFFGGAGFVAAQLAAFNVKIPDQFYPLPMDPKKCQGQWLGAVRASVNGGRQELYWHDVGLSPGAHVRVVDAFAAYVSLLQAALPIGSPLSLGPSQLRRALETSQKGKARSVLVAGLWEVSARPVQPLPYRDAQNQASYPLGRWAGCYWLEEADSLGVTLVQPFGAWSFEKRPFLSIVGKNLLELRTASCFPPFWKSVGVRFVGNLAAEGPKKKIVHVDQISNKKSKDFEHYPLCGDWWIRVSKPQPRSYARIQSYSYATMLCRIALREMMARVRGGILAVHTDGIYVSSHDLSNGRDLELDKLDLSSSQEWCQWRAKDRFDGEWLRFVGHGAGTWYLEDLGEVIAERRTGVPRQMEWTEVKRGKVDLGLYPGAGRTRLAAGWTGTPEVWER